MRRLADRGLGVILSKHESDHAMQVGDTALLVADGRVLASGPLGDVVTGRNLTMLYGISVSRRTGVAWSAAAHE